jgi:aconitate hydratase
MNFIGSPEIAIALALEGRLSFNPVVEELTAADGTKFKLKPPNIAPEIPEKGFNDTSRDDIYDAPAEDSRSVEVTINKDSVRLQKLEPFPKWDGKDFEKLPVLAKVRGKCTTDHISPAGAWLMYRGHLDKISDNLLLGAVNAYSNDEVGNGKNILNGNIESFSHIAREYKKQNMKWIIVGDQNYGEGSSREHAAMTPRYLGCAAVISRSFARIHETNLKKQGVLTLTFKDPLDYDKIMEDDRISITGLNNIKPGKPVKCILHHHHNNNHNRTYKEIYLQHSYNESQIEWFYAGSALNVLLSRKDSVAM